MREFGDDLDETQQQQQQEKELSIGEARQLIQEIAQDPEAGGGERPAQAIV
jgi:hypothetical protein